MATESSGFDEAMDVGTSTISHLKALKTASTITKAGFGAAGGPFTAAVGIAIANRHGIAKIIIVIIAILLLPVLFILMLPGLIFGSLMEDTGALNSNTSLKKKYDHSPCRGKPGSRQICGCSTACMSMLWRTDSYP